MDKHDIDPQFDENIESVVGIPSAARDVRKTLERLRSSDNPVMAEAARDLLAGRISLRDIGRSEAYGAALAESFRKYQDWRASLSPQERAGFDQHAAERWTQDSEE